MKAPVRTIHGVNFYEAMSDGSQTAEIRAVQAAQYMNREFVHGLPMKVANAIYKQMIDTIHADGKRNELKLHELGVLVHNLQVRAANVLNYDNLFGLACIYFYIDGENPAMWDGAHDARKFELMKAASPEDQLFFCAAACSYTPTLTTLSGSDLAACLKETESILSSQRMTTHTTKKPTTT